VSTWHGTTRHQRHEGVVAMLPDSPAPPLRLRAECRGSHASAIAARKGISRVAPPRVVSAPQRCAFVTPQYCGAARDAPRHGVAVLRAMRGAAYYVVSAATSRPTTVPASAEQSWYADLLPPRAIVRTQKSLAPVDRKIGRLRHIGKRQVRVAGEEAQTALRRLAHATRQASAEVEDSASCHGGLPRHALVAVIDRTTVARGYVIAG